MENSINQQNNNEREITIWELFNLILKNWIPAAIITAVFIAVGFIVSFVIMKQNVTTYSFSETVIYSNFSGYPAEWLNSYSDSLTAYLDEKSVSSNIAELAFSKVNGETENEEYTLSVTYTSGTSKSEAEIIAREIIDWHNTSLDDEFIRLIDEKTEELNAVYSEYENKQIAYFDFLNKQNGYYDMLSDSEKYRSLILSYEQLLISYEATLLKVQSGVPLTTEEMERGDYSSEGLKKQIEFYQSEIDRNQQLMDQVVNNLNQMVVDNGIYTSDIEATLEAWKIKKTELSELELASPSISDFYVGDFTLNSSTKSTWKLDIVIAFLLGIVVSIIFIFLKESFLNYKREKNIEQK